MKNLFYVILVLITSAHSFAARTQDFVVQGTYANGNCTYDQQETSELFPDYEIFIPRDYVTTGPSAPNTWVKSTAVFDPYVEVVPGSKFILHLYALASGDTTNQTCTPRTVKVYFR